MTQDKKVIRWREPGLPGSRGTSGARSEVVPRGMVSRSEELRVEAVGVDEVGAEDADPWTEAQTVLGAPSYAVLLAERAAAEGSRAEVATGAARSTSEVRVRPVATATPEVEAGDDVFVQAEEVASFEAMTTALDAPSFDSLQIPIDIEEPALEELAALEVSIARESESAVWEGLDGELGVFLATYDELPIGTEVRLTVHLTGERAFETRARVAWLRNAPGLWPGLGLRLLENRPDVWFRLQRFSHRCRPPMFHC